MLFWCTDGLGGIHSPGACQAKMRRIACNDQCKTSMPSCYLHAAVAPSSRAGARTQPGPPSPAAPTHKPVAAVMLAARCGSLHVRRKSTTALSFTPSGTACCPLRLRCFQSAAAAAAASPPPDATDAEASPEAADAVLRALGLALVLAAEGKEEGKCGWRAVGRAEPHCRRRCHRRLLAAHLSAPPWPAAPPAPAVSLLAPHWHSSAPS